MAKVNINILRETGGVTRSGFGTVLILADTLHPYSVYTDLSGLSEDFATSTTVYEMAQGLFSQQIQPRQFAVAGIDYIAGTDPVTDLSTFLDTLVNEQRDFYFVTMVNDDEPSQKEVSDWAATYKKLHFIRTDIKPIDSTIATWGKNTSVYYTSQVEEYPEMNTLGFGSPLDPGSLTWANLKVQGITPETLSSTEILALETANYNVIIKQYGVVVTNSGLLQGGLYIDQQRSEDYIDVRLEEDVFQLIANLRKIPFTDNGVDSIVSVFNKRLNIAFNQGIIASNEGGQALFTVTAPPVTDMPQEDIDDRTLRQLGFSYVEAGAIENLDGLGRIVNRDSIEIVL